ncbi:MAG: hypothetical protein HOM58_04340 [Rhodospirillaceae bacterium]|jgi:hypothetical protein|nr:hypothetical protein [Rhodospirillaceae bacterium]MBT5456737.1 hypothetical protein [Rhodospirillaceae bacterium]
MTNGFKIFAYSTAIMAATAVPAFAGSFTPLGLRLGNPLSVVMGSTLPFADAGILGLVAAGVIGGVWLARRKR